MGYESNITSFDYVQTDWDGLLDHVTDVTLKEYIVALGASDAAFKFCDLSPDWNLKYKLVT